MERREKRPEVFNASTACGIQHVNAQSAYIGQVGGCVNVWHSLHTSGHTAASFGLLI